MDNSLEFFLFFYFHFFDEISIQNYQNEFLIILLLRSLCSQNYFFKRLAKRTFGKNLSPYHFYLFGLFYFSFF
ncbi:MAG: hypothetical protein EBV46_06680 [Burkholderiaceae bacterium]|nr:hypothetical protein [Synechococcaceae bacterium WB7_1C_051]NCV04114.1 hypothetical protein [Burkholderiaceae bacterium]